MDTNICVVLAAGDPGTLSAPPPVTTIAASPCAAELRYLADELHRIDTAIHAARTADSVAAALAELNHWRRSVRGRDTGLDWAEQWNDAEKVALDKLARLPGVSPYLIGARIAPALEFLEEESAGWPDPDRRIALLRRASNELRAMALHSQGRTASPQVLRLCRTVIAAQHHHEALFRELPCDTIEAEELRQPEDDRRSDALDAAMAEAAAIVPSSLAELRALAEAAVAVADQDGNGDLAPKDGRDTLAFAVLRGALALLPQEIEVPPEAPVAAKGPHNERSPYGIAHLCTEYRRTCDALNASQSVSTPDDNDCPLWKDYEAARDAVGDAELHTLEDCVALADLCFYEARNPNGTEMDFDNTCAGRWTRTILRALPVLAARPMGDCPAAALIGPFAAVLEEHGILDRALVNPVPPADDPRHARFQVVMDQNFEFEELIPHARATSLPGAMLSLIMATHHAQSIDFHEMGREEAKEASRTVVRMLYSAQRVFEKVPGAAVHPVIRKDYMGDKLDPWLRRGGHSAPAVTA